MKFEWRCIICEREIPVYYSGDEEKNVLPNLNGGIISINFGYGSKFDLLEHEIPYMDDSQHHSIHYEVGICDHCFAEKQKLCRLVHIGKSLKKSTLIDQDFN